MTEPRKLHPDVAGPHTPRGTMRPTCTGIARTDRPVRAQWIDDAVCRVSALVAANSRADVCHRGSLRSVPRRESRYSSASIPVTACNRSFVAVTAKRRGVYLPCIMRSALSANRNDLAECMVKP